MKTNFINTFHPSVVQSELDGEICYDSSDSDPIVNDNSNYNNEINDAIKKKL